MITLQYHTNYFTSMEYPEEVLTTSKKGRVEVRSLIDRGSFVRYEYLDPGIGKKTENEIKLFLKTHSGSEQYFIIPMKDKRNLLIPVESKGARKLWDGGKNQAVDL